MESYLCRERLQYASSTSSTLLNCLVRTSYEVHESVLHEVDYPLEGTGKHRYPSLLKLGFTRSTTYKLIILTLWVQSLPGRRSLIASNQYAAKSKLVLVLRNVVPDTIVQRICSPGDRTITFNSSCGELGVPSIAKGYLWSLIKVLLVVRVSR